MAKAKTKSKDMDKEGDSKIFAFLAVFLTIIGFIIALIAKRDDKYVMYYAKQGLVLFIISIVISVIGAIPFIGMISWVLWILFFVIWIIGWINALSGEMKKTFLVSEFSDKIRL